jgi:hypothetical protein
MLKIHVRQTPRPTTPTLTAPEPLNVRPVRLALAERPARILDFDVECRPLHFYGDYVSKEVTAIAWAWTDDPGGVDCVLLGELELPDMLRRFVEVYDRADMVTGHFITGFDLPLLNGALMEQQMPVLADKWAHDTKVHLTRRHGLSGSQENIGATLGLKHPKVSMNQATWREANRLTPEGLELVRERVCGDVKQHIEMRQRLLDLGYLSSPRLWKSGAAKLEVYTP